MRANLRETLQNIADNTWADNTVSNFMIRNLATNMEISKGAANSRVAKLNALGYVYIEEVGQGHLIAVTQAGRDFLEGLEPEIPKSKKKRANKALPEGYVLLKDFVKNPSAARNKLRQLNEPKPCSQWAWPKDDVERIKKLIGEA